MPRDPDDSLCPHGRSPEAYPCPDCQQNQVAEQPRKRDVLLAYPHPGTVKAEFMNSVLDAIEGPGTRVAELMDFRTGPALAQARNQITRGFLDKGYEWLWQVDADMVFSRNTLPALLEAADPVSRPVVGALAFVQTGPAYGEQVPNMYEATRDDQGLFTFRSMARFPLGELVQVACTGAACLLVHRDVFTTLSKEVPGAENLWWAETVADGSLMGEDFSFCMRCALAQIPVFVHTGVQVGHTKAQVIGNVYP